MCARGISNSGGIKSVKGGSCRFSVTQCCILFPPVPDIKASHPRKELRSAKRRANQTTRLCFSFYCLLTDYFYNMIMYGDKRLCLERQTHRSDCTSVIRETYWTHCIETHWHWAFCGQGLSSIHFWIWKTIFFLLKRVYQCCGCIGTNFLHHLQWHLWDDEECSRFNCRLAYVSNPNKHFSKQLP